MSRIKILVVCRYEFYNNTIKAGKGYIVTEENENYYFCKDIGESYKKSKENKPEMKIGNCWCELVIWKTREIDAKDIFYQTGDINNDLRIELENALKERIEEIEYI